MMRYGGGRTRRLGKKKIHPNHEITTLCINIGLLKFFLKGQWSSSPTHFFKVFKCYLQDNSFLLSIYIYIGMTQIHEIT